MSIPTHDHARRIYYKQIHRKTLLRVSFPFDSPTRHLAEQIVPAELDAGAVKLALEALDLAGYVSVDKQATLQAIVAALSRSVDTQLARAMVPSIAKKHIGD